MHCLLQTQFGKVNSVRNMKSSVLSRDYIKSALIRLLTCCNHAVMTVILECFGVAIISEGTGDE